MLLRGLARRCPRCGAGKLFRRWFWMKEDCPGCGMHFEREEGFFLGAFVVNFVLTEGALALYLLVGFVLTWPDPPAVPLAIGAAAVAIGMPLLAYPFSKTIWTAIDLIGWGRDRRE
jgi:uncharacterized protein (DUF983 family)